MNFILAIIVLPFLSVVGQQGKEHEPPLPAALRVEGMT